MAYYLEIKKNKVVGAYPNKPDKNGEYIEVDEQTYLHTPMFSEVEIEEQKVKRVGKPKGKNQRLSLEDRVKRIEEHLGL